MKSLFIFCLSFIVFGAAYSQVYPPPSCVLYDNGTLIICPPDSVPGYTGGLISYNIYLDDEFLENIPVSSQEDTAAMILDPLPNPGYRTFCATAVYLNWISDFTCDTAYIRYGYELPFTEDWSSGSFETNNWAQEGEYWTIGNNGSPGPFAEFQGNAGLTDYFIPLTSYVFQADSIIEGHINITFSLKLDCNNNTGNEKLYLQAWDWENQVWMTANNPVPTNANGSFDWTNFSFTLGNAKGNLFKVRFVAAGLTSPDIAAWYVDNIHIFRTCIEPHGLIASLNEDNMVELYWDSPTGCGEYFSFLWYYNYFNGNSIGTDDEAEFDVAARWTPDQLAEYANSRVTRIYFYPAEAAAEYTVRVWKGDSATLIYEQPAPNPVINQWNYVQLDNPYLIDIYHDLWVGYHIEASTGYPAGVDVGPAVNGLGNMMLWDGQWQTLLEVNPELDYNWLIEAYVGSGDPQYCGNRIYRKVNNGEYYRVGDIPMDNYFLDDQADPADMNCYMVTDVFAKNYDTCESYSTNESCVQPVVIQDNIEDKDLRVFPNPASEELFVKSSSEMIEIQMIDLTGRIFYEERNLKQVASIRLRDFSRGIYMMKITLKDDLIYRKVLIN